MRASPIAGIILIVLGAIALTYSGFTYTTSEKKIDIGPIKVIEDKQHTVPIPPLLGGLAMAAGIGLLVFGKR